MSRVVDLLADLVAVPSVNPRHADSGAPTVIESGETEVARYVASWAGARGWPTYLDLSQPGRHNVYVSVPGAIEEDVLLQTHSDTVEVEGMTVPPFELTLSGDRASGRGACDAKGQLAMFMAAIEAASASSLAHRGVLLAVCIDEEERFSGVLTLCEWLAERGIQPIGAIVGEPTELRMVTSHKGVVRGRIVCRGEGGHSSRPEDVTNPLVTAARVVTHIQDVIVPGLAERDSTCGPPTMAVTMVSGGDAINLIPREVVLHYDRRTTPEEEPEQVWAALASDLEKAHPHVKVPRPALMDRGLPASADLSVPHILAAAMVAHELNPEAVGVPYGSDASKLARIGIPSVVFGAGSISRAHTVDEYVELEQLDRGVGVLVDLLTRRTPDEQSRSKRR